MIIRTLVLTTSLLALPLAAVAQTGGHSYIAFGAGFNKMQQEDVDAHLAGSPTDSPGEVLTSVGPSLVGAFGRSLHNGFRIEAETNYLSNGIKGETGLSGEDLGTGTEKKYGVMANGVYEFRGTHVMPYLGGGIGGQFVNEPDAVSSSGGVVVAVTGGTKGSFAYQVIGGAAFPIRKGLAFTAEYRYLALTGTRTYTGTATVPGLGSFALTDDSSNDKNHSVLFGIRCVIGG